ncbi:PREDICTED: transcription initiation factor TFIID subunit 12 [Ceratosolen solmsi marchali]|uniref:Transcription initiation factor TFIID subunit 12 n=1 Tax=Ceratosolen solmsi marchali TaxID=326594 RepID=A0AAJ6YE69_9HYME|nr:PREDICTED: transcription initiation factor TFIID subunit 12 [Ceratosolen solmsi marchali]
MSQEMSSTQNTNTGPDITSPLGVLPSIGSANQNASLNTAPQANVTSSIMQSQSQSQSQPTQFSPQTIKSQPQLNQPNVQSTLLDYPQFLTKTRLQDLVKEVDPTEQLDEEVEEMLLQLADDFVETTINAACLLAKHRHANTVEVKDVQLHLEKNWNMWIPGFGTDEIRPYKRATVTEAHKQRLALIRKSIKKY